MAFEWIETNLGECAAWLSGGTPSKGNEAFWNGSIPWVSAKDMKSFRLYEAEDHISPIAVGNGCKLVPAGTVLLLVRGMTLHNDVPICMVTREMAFNQDIKALRPAKNVDAAFLAYWLLAKKPELLASVDHAGHGTGRLATYTLKEMPVLLPPLAEQKAIAAVLGALDDKIELNRRMNATLEAMARALFQSWFVDFDPVRAKLDGREPVGLDPDTAALFPDSYQDSPMGHIPKYWKAGTIAEAFNLTMGQSPPGDTYNEEGSGLPFYQGRTDFGFRFPSRRIYCTAPSRYANPGDTLVSVRAPVGDINMANEVCSIGRGVAAVRHKTGATSFTYYSMGNLSPVFARFEAEGTVFGSINKDNFEKLPFAIPPDEVVAAYEQNASPLDYEIRKLEDQSRTLATLRDTLLPKLLSGELSVSKLKTIC
jgi:type I restriction enzyme S subunit